MGRVTASEEWLHSKRGRNGKFGEKFLPRALIYWVILVPLDGGATSNIIIGPTVDGGATSNIIIGPIVDCEQTN
jgi:hypothetical protein